MAWINAVILVVTGMVIGFIVAWLIMRDNTQHKDLKRELEKSQNELEQYRQKLTEHFSGSADLLDNISRDYNKLYQHLARYSSDLIPNQPEQENPFSKPLMKITNLHKEPDQTHIPSGSLNESDNARQVAVFNQKSESH